MKPRRTRQRRVGRAPEERAKIGNELGAFANALRDVLGLGPLFQDGRGRDVDPENWELRRFFPGTYELASDGLYTSGGQRKVPKGT